MQLQNRRFAGDLDAYAHVLAASRVAVMDALSPVTLQDIFRTLFPTPCTKRYTAVVLLPQDDGLKTRVASALTSAAHAAAEAWQDTPPGTRTAALLTVGALAAALVVIRLRWRP